MPRCAADLVCDRGLANRIKRTERACLLRERSVLACSADLLVLPRGPPAVGDGRAELSAVPCRFRPLLPREVQGWEGLARGSTQHIELGWSLSWTGIWNPEVITPPGAHQTDCLRLPSVPKWRRMQ